MKAVILAGGKGTRLKPFTTNFPKPLMPVGEKPILELVLTQLKKAGIKEIFITTGHLGEMIRMFFGNGEKLGLNIKYSIEDKPLGTAGPIKILRNDLDRNFILMNGDVLANLDYKALVEFHVKNKNAATIGTALRKQFIDFGLVELSDNLQFISWKEKPTLEYLVSMGIYVFSPSVLDFLPKADFFTAPDLIQILANNNQKVMGYIHTGYWLDIGRPEDYAKACKEFEEIFNNV